MTNVALQKQTALKLIDGSNITRPDAQVMLANGMSRFRIVKVTIVHLELENVENPVEKNVELLDHTAVSDVQRLLVVDQDLDIRSVLGGLCINFGGSGVQQLWQVEFCAVKGLKLKAF